jgi:hypothetical protein
MTETVAPPFYSMRLQFKSDTFLKAARQSTAPFVGGLLGFSRFYGTLANQERDIEDDQRDRSSATSAQEDAWLNEGGREPDPRHG